MDCARGVVVTVTRNRVDKQSSRLFLSFCLFVCVSVFFSFNVVQYIRPPFINRRNGHWALSIVLYVLYSFAAAAAAGRDGMTPHTQQHNRKGLQQLLFFSSLVLLETIQDEEE